MIFSFLPSMHPFSDCFFCLPNSLHFSRSAYIIQQNQPFCHGLLQRGKPLWLERKAHTAAIQRVKVTFHPHRKIEKIEGQKVGNWEASFSLKPFKRTLECCFPTYPPLQGD
ncbi:hypothetical protein CDAR_456591 [Caerostris darwini]|uniref:Uncharacterized protein n=1 Tax=Caerostris darwini TaxID=1538125 RepID=A0AAV4T9S1_9ARAC|nr:hypothetical protein CDAR_456591 [Caerostris darwini]